jgi:hypothetical protein
MVLDIVIKHLKHYLDMLLSTDVYDDFRIYLVERLKIVHEQMSTDEKFE